MLFSLGGTTLSKNYDARGAGSQLTCRHGLSAYPRTGKTPGPAGGEPAGPMVLKGWCYPPEPRAELPPTTQSAESDCRVSTRRLVAACNLALVTVTFPVPSAKAQLSLNVCTRPSQENPLGIVIQGTNNRSRDHDPADIGLDGRLGTAFCRCSWRSK